MTDATIEASPISGAALAESIAPHLPLLRRYARALTGSQSSGDAYVAAVLEAIIGDRAVLGDGAQNLRVALYSAFQRIWASVDLALPEDADTVPIAVRIARARMGKLSPQSQQALLLTAVEGFTIAEAGLILDVHEAEAATLVAEAMVALRRGAVARVLIIEDEPIIAMDLEAVVSDMGHEVVGMADTRDTAVALALAERPDLVLADIQLADGSSGIDAVRDILAAMAAPVIFITAYPDRLLTGARPEPTFLIAKPFQTETVQAAITQALFFQVPERA